MEQLFLVGCGIKVSDMNRDHQIFLNVSSILTGFEIFDLLATGLSQEYMKYFVDDPVYQKFSVLIISLYPSESNSNLDINQVLDLDNNFKEKIDRLVLLWYTGVWFESSDYNYVVSSNSYRNGLLWKTLGIHTLGGNPPGYGSWELPPE